jgi:hypothetical protein
MFARWLEARMSGITDQKDTAWPEDMGESAKHLPRRRPATDSVERGCQVKDVWVGCRPKRDIAFSAAIGSNTL